MRGEDVQIHISKNSNDWIRALETPILIVKFSDDGSFPVIIQTQNV